MRSNYKDITGQRFGRLVALSVKRENKRTLWLCTCDCGNKKEIRAELLKNGSTKSCGCFAQENRRLKGRWKSRDAICIICGTMFTSTAASETYCCSKKCKKKYTANYYKDKKYSNVENKLINLVNSTKHRAKKQEIEYNLDKEFIIDLYNKQDGKCSKTKLPFVINNCLRSEGKGPWAASIDRIDSNKGYTKDNVQLVCLMYNLCKCMWTDNEVKQFAEALINETIRTNQEANG
jgi:hypothetical protein